MTENNNTGHTLELSQASTNLARAITTGDGEALRKAADDHATALNSQATAMAASIASPLYAQQAELKSMIQGLSEAVTNARQADLTWRTEERIQRDTQHDRLYDELDRLARAAEESGTRLGKLEEGQVDLLSRLDADERRLDSKRLRIEALEADVQHLKAWVTGLPTPEESRRLIALLEQLAAERGGYAR